MRISNAKLFIDGAFTEGGIEFDERIVSYGKDITGGIDAECGYLIPGLIDIHTHAAVGEDASDGSPEGLEKMSVYYAKDGVTSWLPTTMTIGEDDLTKAMHAMRDFVRTQCGAMLAGVNLEGPFVSVKKCGAQNPKFIKAPDADMFFRLNEASGGKARLVTVAPEEPGSVEFIKKVSETCTVSVGHTSASYDTAMRAFDAGASHATHLFNAMPPLHHRNPGVIAAASDAGATVELITDGFLIHPSVIRLVHRLFCERLVLISDSLRCAGMPDGEYELGGQPITMKNGKATLSGTDTLAGSSVHLMEGLRRAVSFGVPLEAAVMAATYSPAKAVGLENEIGSIKQGCFADLVILDNELNVKNVFINGRLL